jgi:glucoamylase
MAFHFGRPPNGPVWHRYNGDGYGEHDDGSAFDGSGRGRAWPLLAGERGHYELVAGRDPRLYLKAMVAMTGPGGLIPEQVWDTAAIPSKRSRLSDGFGHATCMGARRIHQADGFIPPGISIRPAYCALEAVRRTSPKWQTRYLVPACADRANCARSRLVIATPRSARIHWGADGSQNVADACTRDTGLGLHVLDLHAASIGRSRSIDFTFQWLDREMWVGEDFRIVVSS